MNAEFNIEATLQSVFKTVEALLTAEAIAIDHIEVNKPWGGYFVIAPSSAAKFVNHFFREESERLLSGARQFSPKILVVAPGHRLSWQYHARRVELWKLFGGKALISRSVDDTERPANAMFLDQLVVLKKGERHRLIGAPDAWGAVAEIWEHTEADHLSDEADIVRLQDDYRRK